MVNVIRGGLAAIVLLSATSSNADDWARFRGPNGLGVGDVAALPAELGPGPNVAWKTVLPPGHSSPVVSGARVFLTAHEGEALLTIALDARTGAIQWRRESPRDRTTPIDKRNGPPSPSPLGDGPNVILVFPDHGPLPHHPAGRP